MTPFYTRVKDGHDRGGGPDFWEHYCQREKDIMGTLKGEECNWCGMTEEVVKHNKKQRDFMKKYMEWREDESKTDKL